MSFDLPALPFKTSHFGSHITNEQHTVAGEISVDNGITVKNERARVILLQRLT